MIYLASIQGIGAAVRRELAVAGSHLRRGVYSARLGLVLICAMVVPAVAYASPMAWFSTGDRLFQADVATATLVRSIQTPVTRLAADHSGGVWVIDAVSLRRFDSNGVQTLSMTLATLGFGSDASFGPIRLSVDPLSGHVWLWASKVVSGANAPSYVENRIVVVSAAGQTLPIESLTGGALQSISVGLDGQAWALTSDALVRLTPLAGNRSAWPLTIPPAESALSTAFDAFGQVLWYVARESQSMVVRVDLASGVPVQGEPELVTGYVRQMAVNPLDGSRLLKIWFTVVETHPVDPPIEIQLGGVECEEPVPAAGAVSPTICRIAPEPAPLPPGVFWDETDSCSSEVKGRTMAIDPITGTSWVVSCRGVHVGDAMLLSAGPLIKKTIGEISITPSNIRPSLNLLSPLAQASINNARPPITLAYGAKCNDADCTIAADRLGAFQITASLDGQSIGQHFTIDATTSRASYTPASALSDGAHPFVATARDKFNQVSNTVTSSFTTDTIAPSLISLSPSNDSRVIQPSITLSGSVSEAGGVLLGSTAVQGPNFSFPISLLPGTNAFTLSATDLAANSAQFQLQYHYLTLAMTAPVDGASLSASVVSVTGTFAGPADAAVTVNGVTASLANGNFSASVPLAVGVNQVVATITSAGVSTSKTISVTRTGSAGGTLEAPPLDPAVPTTMAKATAFLYSGPNPVQTGVAPGTIEPKRAAVVRGKLQGRNGEPLAGVKVSIHNNPQYGQTLSRADGMYDLAVNGGGVLTISYSKDGLLPVTRVAQVPWQDYVVIDDVVLTALDPAVTAITLGSGQPLQVARGSAVTDQDGMRRVTMMFPAGTLATMVLPNGQQQSLGSINVRATEFTVGVDGPKAMPALLEPSTAYTYAVELSVDEAIAAGASQVNFSQVVPVYLENFLNFPVGGIVPSGYYDRAKAAWVPAPNGRVVKIVSVNNGLAELDINGDGQADSGAALLAHGVSTTELAKLAETYAVGQSLWRVPVTHFTPYDWNWAYHLPIQPSVELSVPDHYPPVESCPNQKTGSIIECENQTLKQVVPVTGTPLTLHYSSTLSRKSDEPLRIQVTGSEVPSYLLGVRLVVAVAGRVFEWRYAPAANISQAFEWDRQDFYGRRVHGAAKVTVRVGYDIAAPYAIPPDAEPAFGFVGGQPLTILPSRQGVTFWAERSLSYGALRADAQALGGWTLGQVHSFDSSSRIFIQGDGRWSYLGKSGAGFDRLLSIGSLPLYSEFAAAPNGDVYSISATELGVLRRRRSGSGVFEEVAQHSFAISGAVAVNGAGEAYYTLNDGYNGGIYKYTPSIGTRIKVAGCDEGQAADCIVLRAGGPSVAPASKVVMRRPYAMAVDRFGSVYVSDTGENLAIYKLDPSGLMSRFAGNGSGVLSGDGGSALDAGIGTCLGMAFDRQDNLIISCVPSGVGKASIRKIATDGRIQVVAGGGDDTMSEGIAGSEVNVISPWGLVVDDLDQSVIFSEMLKHRVRRIRPDGTVVTIAGNGGDGTGPIVVGAIPRTTEISNPAGLALTKSGTLIIGQQADSAMEIGRGFRMESGVPFIVPASDGTEFYEFDGDLRHRRTVDSRTRAIKAEFTYSNGYVTSVKDADGNVTQIERDYNGVARAIVSPFNQRTLLAYDSNGYLSEITDPLSQSHKAEYSSATGLMTRFENPRGFAAITQFDSSSGRLLREEGPDGGSWTLSRVTTESGHTVSVTSAESRTSSYQVERLPTLEKRRTDTNPDGTTTVVLEGLDRVTRATLPDGSQVMTASTPDPRFGLESALISRTTRMPSGLQLVTESARTVTLAQASDPLSLVNETTSQNTNGRVATSTYVAATRQATTTSAAGRSIVTRSDLVGRPVLVQVGGLDAVNLTYDERGRPKTVSQGSGAEQRTLAYDYGTDGFLERVTDALSREVVFQRDAVGRIKQAALPGVRVMASTFDANGNTKTFTPPGSAGHAFDYSAVDLETFYTAPAVPGVADLATGFVYNRDRDLTQINWPGGVSASFSYGAAGGKLSAITPSNGAGAPISFAYSAATGQVSSLSTSDATLSFGYDGSLPKTETRSGTLPASLERVFDNDFRVTTLKLNGESVASFSYDDDSLLTQSGAMTITRHASHGLISATALGGLTASQSYNGFGELKTFEAKQGAAVLLSYQLGYDKLGRVVSKTETVTEVTNTYEYGYDAAGRLNNVKVNGIQASSYGFDGNGNRTHVNGVLDATFDAQDRLVSRGSVAYGYTDRGTLRQTIQGSQTTSYDYDAFGNLRSVIFPGGGRVDYVVDGMQRRIARKVNNVLVQGFVYQDGLRLVAELDGSGQVVARFVHGEKPNVAEYMLKGGNTYRLLTDHLGSVRLVVNVANGQIAQRIDYDEWGRVTADSNPGFQPFGYAGGLYDTATKLVRFGARDYDAEAGRWTAKDPIRFSGGDGNLYAYVGGNPISFVDPYGLFCLKDSTIGAIGGAVGGAFSGAVAGLQTGGPHAIAAAATLGVLGGAIGGLAGYVGSDTLSASGIGGAAAAGTSTPTIRSGALGGGLGGAIAYDLQRGGMRDTLAAMVGGGAGGALGGAVAGILSERAVKGAISGGLGGLSGAALSSAIVEALRAGNDCGCGK